MLDMPINCQWDVQNDFKLSFHSSVAELFQGIWMSFFVLFLLYRKPNPKFVSVMIFIKQKALRRMHAVIYGYWLHSILITLCKEKWKSSYSYSLKCKSAIAWKVLRVGGGGSITANLFQNNYLTLKILYSFRT